MFHVVPLATLVAVGCADDRGANDMFASSGGHEAGDDGPTGGSGDGGTGSGGDGSDGGDGSEGGSGDDDGVRYDVGEGQDSGGDGMGGCNKVDFLFVVDNSSSMFAHQQALTASFPGFVQSITDRVESDDFHIMVVDTDTKADPSDGCGECYERCVEGIAKNCGFNDPNDSGAPGVCNGQSCTAISPEPPDACDYVLGAGVVDDRFEQSCPLSTGDRYIAAGQTDLMSTFECIAQTGVYGTGKELPLGAMVEAVGMNGPGQCNEGFIRDDAILVVTILSDALYAGEAYNPPQPWFDALVAAKNDKPEHIVVLGLFRSDPAVVPGPACQLGAGTCGGGGFTNCNTTYEDFVALFGDRGIAHSICIDDFEPFFTSALDTIELTCDDFMPEG